MQRDLASLASTRFDLLVIGGGIYGACIARDAAYRGLNVALVERGDFGHATSHNSLRLIHGGLRYLQHLDIRRVRQSVCEQNFWLRAAPHIVRPLRFMMPTFGYGTRGPGALWSATKLHAMIAFDRNRGVATSNRRPAGGLLSRQALLDFIPGLDTEDINAGAYWYDAQILDPDRLILEVLRDAANGGATIANYVEVTGFLKQGNKIIGVRALDRIAKSEVEIASRITVCAGGPWIHQLGRKAIGKDTKDIDRPMTRGMNLITRPLGPKVAFGVRSARSSDAILGKSRRMYFATPLPRCSVIGTSHFPYKGRPDDCVFTENEVLAFLDEFNAAYPAANLKPDDVYYWHGGLTPADEDSDSDEIKRSRQAEIIDHGLEDDTEGFISVIGVKYTTARLVAEKAVDLIYQKKGVRPPPCTTKFSALPGAKTDKLHPLFPTYGKFADDLAALYPEHTANSVQATFVACCTYALRSEMAIKLEDLVLRRTNLAREGRLSNRLFEQAADLMATTFNWSNAHKQTEIDNARNQLAAHGVHLGS
ncbi:glycerol-3-phosphate dehydrogenase/oxidase [Gammaproteobacteria bacterium]|nr:glycerol-3-phosphate dehydrogenase/oxidase [Gammaproteobacteria bacterium]